MKIKLFYKLVTFAITISLLMQFFVVADAQDTSRKILESNTYTITYNNSAYSGENTISDIPSSQVINTVLYNLRNENPDVLINIYSDNGAVPAFYSTISNYVDRRMYIIVRKTNSDPGTKFILLSDVRTFVEDDFEKYPVGIFNQTDTWKFNKYRTNIGYTAVCEENGNRFLRQIVPAKSDGDYENTSYTSTYSIDAPLLKVEKGSIAKLSFRLRRKGGSMNVQLRDVVTESTGHNFRTIYNFSDYLSVFYSSYYVTPTMGTTDANGDRMTFSEGEWVEFTTVFDRRDSDDSKNYISMHINGNEAPVSKKIRFSDYPLFMWEEFKMSFGFSNSSAGEKRAEFDIDDFSFVTNGNVSLPEDKFFIYSQDDTTGIEYSGSLFSGSNKITLKVAPSADRVVYFIAAEKENGTLVGIKLEKGMISSDNTVTIPMDFVAKNAGKNKIEFYLWQKPHLIPLRKIMNPQISKAAIAAANGHPRVVGTKKEFDKIRTSTHPLHLNWKETVINKADSICSDYTTTNKKSSYYIGNPTGTTNGFSDVANRIKEMGNVLGMAYQITGDKKYSQTMYNAVLAASEIDGWYDGTVSNLTVSYMVEGFSLCYDWCFDAYTVDERNTVAEIAIEKCLMFAMAEYNNLDRGSHTWSTTYTNHNSIPNANFITASVAFSDYSPQICETVLHYAVERIKNYLAGLAPDGGWWEGEMYTNLLFSHMAKASETLRINFGYDYIITATKSIKGTADFQMAVKGPNGTYNFAELLNPNKYCMPEMLWLANAYNRSDVRDWALKNINFASAKNCALALLWAPDPDDVSEYSFKNHYVRGIEHVTLGTGDTGDANWLSILGGVNMGSHKHLDLGSFVYDSQGVRWANELGLDNYYKGYHCETSKEKIFYRSRSEGHNTLVINPSSADGGQRMNDKNGISKGEVVSYNLRDENPFAIYDLSTAYSDKAHFVKRGFRLINNTGFIVRDEFETIAETDNQADDEVFWFMHTNASISVSSDGKTATLTQDGKSVEVRVLEENLFFTVENSMTPEPILTQLLDYSQDNGKELNKQKWNGHKPGNTDTSDDMKKLQIKHTGTGKGTITVVLSAAGTQIPTDAQKSLSQWN